MAPPGCELCGGESTNFFDISGRAIDSDRDMDERGHDELEGGGKRYAIGETLEHCFLTHRIHHHRARVSLSCRMHLRHINTRLRFLSIELIILFSPIEPNACSCPLLLGTTTLDFICITALRIKRVRRQRKCTLTQEY